MKRPSYTAYMADHDTVALTDNASTIPDRPKSQANTPLSHGLERRFSSIHRVTFYWSYVRTLLHTCLRVLRDVTHILQAGCAFALSRINGQRVFLFVRQIVRETSRSTPVSVHSPTDFTIITENIIFDLHFSDLSAICHKVKG